MFYLKKKNYWYSLSKSKRLTYLSVYDNRDSSSNSGVRTCERPIRGHWWPYPASTNATREVWYWGSRYLLVYRSCENEIFRMYFDTSLKTSRRDCSGISCHVLVTQFRNFLFFKKDFLGVREEMDGRDGTGTSTQGWGATLKRLLTPPVLLITIYISI